MIDKKILLSFDAEEFDIPEEYGQKIDEETKINVSREGLKGVLALLDRLNIRATFFTTANFALHNQKLIKEISKKHEIASHGFYHSSFSEGDLKKSRDILEKITEKRIIGFRMPRLSKINENNLARAGYKYNSSMSPIYMPGRYNNFFEKRTAYRKGEIVNIPLSATPLIRVPINWLSFKNFPLALIKVASIINLIFDNYLVLYFHPWEFVNINKYRLPWYVSRYSGEKMIERLEKYLLWLGKKGKFITFSEFAESFLKKNNRAP